MNNVDYMTKIVYVWDDEQKKFVDRATRAASVAPKVHIINDSMEPTWHPCDGQYYDSKRKFRAVTKAHGKTEVGNDPAFLREDSRSEKQYEQKTIEAIKRAWNEVVVNGRR